MFFSVCTELTQKVVEQQVTHGRLCPWAFYQDLGQEGNFQETHSGSVCMYMCVHVCVYFFLFFFLGPHPWHVEVPRLGVESELQLLAYATATATPDPTCLCNLYHSSEQHWILNPLNKAKDRTRILMETSQVPYHCTTMGTLAI